MKPDAYTERVVIPLPTGEDLPAEVRIYEDDKGRWWTRITPEVGAVIPASGIAAEVGDTHDYIYDLESRGRVAPSEMVRLFVVAWERDQERD